MINVCVKKNDMYSSEEILSIAQQVFSNELTGIAAVSAQLNESFVQAIAILQHCTGKIIVSGIGKSGHVAQKIAATLSSTGTPSFFLHPAEALHGDLGVISPTDVVIAISYSGESAELLAMMPIIKRHNIEIIAITANIYSALANYANTTIPITIAKEACPLNLAPTTSTTATMVLGDAIAITLLTVKGFKATDFALSHPGGQLGRRLLTRVSDIMHTGKTIPLLSITASFQEVICEISTKLYSIYPRY